jgi:uncharacterized protein YunC (DUF1805 family)
MKVKIESIEIEGYTVTGIKLEDVSVRPILIIKGKKGLLTCGYFKTDVADAINDAIAVVTNVKDFDEMLDSKVVAVSENARKAGIKIGETGREALLKLC